MYVAGHRRVRFSIFEIECVARTVTGVSTLSFHLIYQQQIHVFVSKKNSVIRLMQQEKKGVTRDSNIFASFLFENGLACFLRIPYSPEVSVLVLKKTAVNLSTASRSWLETVFKSPMNARVLKNSFTLKVVFFSSTSQKALLLCRSVFYIRRRDWKSFPWCLSQCAFVTNRWGAGNV